MRDSNAETAPRKLKNEHRKLVDREREKEIKKASAKWKKNMLPYGWWNNDDSEEYLDLD